MSKSKSESTKKKTKKPITTRVVSSKSTESQLALLVKMALGAGLAWTFTLRAIDSGSLVFYALTILAVYLTIHFAKELVTHALKK